MEAMTTKRGRTIFETMLADFIRRLQAERLNGSIR